MSSVPQGQHIEAPVLAARKRDGIVVGAEIVRHKLSTRLIHWSVAITFFLCVFTGMPIWTPIFGWMAAFVGGLEVARLIHPYTGILFFIASLFQYFHWLPDMHFEKDQKGWFGPKLVAYLKWEQEPATEGGKYNGGQKFFFYMVSLAALGLLLSGIPIWFPLGFPTWLRELCFIVHDITFVLFFCSIVVHIYLGTAAEPGTFRAMTRGTVTRAWARFHHPQWYRDVTGSDEARRS